MSSPADQFGQYIKAVATELWGTPQKGGTKTETRFGSGRTINESKGSFWVHGEDVGGGVLDLIVHEGKADSRKDAVGWLRDHGFHIEDNREPQRGSNRNAGPTDDGRDKPRMQIVKTWDYVDEKGDLIFQVCRLENGLTTPDGKKEKSYRQRRPDPSKRDGWDWKTAGVRLVPYRLPEITEAMAQGAVIYIVEGEKAADRLWAEGIPATTNARGAGKWTEELNEYFKGARVVVIPDNDPQATDRDGNLKFHQDGRPVFVGQDHADHVATSLLPLAKEVKLLNLPDLPPKGDVVEWFDEVGGNVDKLYELAAKTKKFEAAPFRSAFNAIPWQNMDDPAPEHEYLVKGVLTRGEVSAIAGPSKSGKTFVGLDMAMSIALGKEWMGRRTIKGGVIYQAGEGQKGIKKRIRAYRQRHKLDKDADIPFVLMPARINLYKDDDQTNAFIAEAKHWESTFGIPLELIVIDTWSTATTGANENDGKDVGAVLERCDRISKATGAHVAIVFHMNADGSKIRGHTSILANLENVLLARQVEGMRDEDGRQLREVVVDKNKDGEDGVKIRFVLAQVVLGQDEDGDDITSCVIYPPNGEDKHEAENTGGMSITPQENVLIRAIEKAIEEYGVAAPESTGLPRDLKVVEWKRVLTAYDRLTFDDIDTDKEDDATRKKRLDARRKELKRVGERLMQKGAIAKDDKLVWLTGRHKERAAPRRSTRPVEPEPVSHDLPDDAGDFIDF